MAARDFEPVMLQHGFVACPVPPGILMHDMMCAVSAPSQFRSKEISKSNVVDDMVESNREFFMPNTSC
jgi:hypothetical protein